MSSVTDVSFDKFSLNFSKCQFKNLSQLFFTFECLFDFFSQRIAYIGRFFPCIVKYYFKFSFESGLKAILFLAKDDFILWWLTSQLNCFLEVPKIVSSFGKDVESELIIDHYLERFKKKLLLFSKVLFYLAVKVYL